MIRVKGHKHFYLASPCRLNKDESFFLNRPERTAEQKMFFRNKKTVQAHELDKVPDHIAFVMDGNGRWAKKRGLARSIGHAEGARNLREIVKACYEMHVRFVTVFAFSTENWNRPSDEINQLMSLLLDYLRIAVTDLEGRRVRIRIIGSREGLPVAICSEIEQVEAATLKHTEMDFIIAINYGGRQDIVQATRNIARKVEAGELAVEAINALTITNELYTSGIPDPDLLIRTSGELRLSNFLSWQTAYTELFFSDLFWPDFKVAHLKEAIGVYAGRKRRFGGIKC